MSARSPEAERSGSVAGPAANTTCRANPACRPGQLHPFVRRCYSAGSDSRHLLPFYIADAVTHRPMHAPPGDVVQYKGKYDGLDGRGLTRRGRAARRAPTDPPRSATLRSRRSPP
jgi:hypothetical protein